MSSSPLPDPTSICMNYQTECRIWLSASTVQSCTLFLVYGIYIVLFGVCTSVLFGRKQERLRIHCLLITALFVLATATTVLNTYVTLINVQADSVYYNFPFMPNGTASPPEPRHASKSITFAAHGLTVTSNLLTDVILLWRCYLVWGSRVRIVLLPILLCSATNVLGYLTMSDGVHVHDFASLEFYPDKMAPQSVILLCFSFGTLCSNLLLTILIAGRVFYISHQVAKLTKQPIAEMYRTIISASIESGLLYPAAIAGYAISLFLSALGTPKRTPLFKVNNDVPPGSATLACKVLYSCLVPIMGIASTMIIVRSALGIAVNDEKSFKTTVLRGRDMDERSGGIVNTIVDIQKHESMIGWQEQDLEAHVRDDGK
ncbi:hypothetical protein PM082_024794 [Marasmius tenuissimus]|nr:hypothetical protein PM082_024794 [Marasmius tenuissimus]